MPFVRNAWYAGAFASEVVDQPLARVLLNEPVVFYRQPDGLPVALQDRCCHRQLPLSAGRVVGERLVCGYHGMEFDATGACVHVPGQDAIPRSARVRSFPVVERHRMIWIWMGEPARADPDLIEDFHWLDDPGWRWKGTVYGVKANYRLIVENLLDLNHLPFVHRSTIGNMAVVDAKVTVEQQGDTVTVTRWMLDSPPPPSYVKAGASGNVDRWQIITYTPPTNVRLHTGGCPVGTRAPEGARAGGIAFRNLNMITPETERSTHYFWAEAHDFDIDKPEVTDFVFAQFDEAFREDWVVFEAQQRAMDLAPDAPRMHLLGDRGQQMAMRILDAAIAADTLTPKGESR